MYFVLNVTYEACRLVRVAPAVRVWSRDAPPINNTWDYNRKASILILLRLFMSLGFFSLAIWLHSNKPGPNSSTSTQSRLESDSAVKSGQTCVWTAPSVYPITPLLLDDIIPLFSKDTLKSFGTE